MNTFYGLLGQSLEHSISPLIHRCIFEILGMSAHYHLFEVEKNKLQKAVDGLKALGAVGVNVTIPYKTEIIQYLDTVSPEAAAIGAVNTIFFGGHTAKGYNTDYCGFEMLLERHGIGTDGMRALVLGYGGGAKAVIRFLADHGIRDVTVAVRNIHGRSISNVTGEPDKITFVDYKKLPLQMDGDLIINCTPYGMHPHIDDTPVPAGILKRYHTAIDLIYNPLNTKFLRTANKAGLRAVNGLYMLVGQAAAAQTIWNNVQLSDEEIDRIYNKAAEHMQREQMRP